MNYLSVNTAGKLRDTVFTICCNLKIFRMKTTTRGHESFLGPQELNTIRACLIDSVCILPRVNYGNIRC